MITDNKEIEQKINDLLFSEAHSNLKLPLDLINTNYRFLFVEPWRSFPLQLIYGGAGSGKSVAIAQRNVFDIVNEPRNFLIVRKVAATLKNSIFQEIVKVISQWGLDSRFIIQENYIRYMPTSCCMLFKGLDKTEKIKSITPLHGVFTDIHCEEMTEITESDYEDVGLRMRGKTQHGLTKRKVGTFNPILKTHWISKRFFNEQNIGFAHTNDMLIYKTTFRDNDFLTEQDKRDFLNLTGYKKQVYADGDWGVFGDIIFTNWEIGSCKDVNFDKTKYGLDFGFTNASAGLKIGIQENQKTIYIQEEVYLLQATTDILADKLRPMTGRNLIWCDCADPCRVTELTHYKIRARGAEKPKNSVYFFIQWLLQWRVVIDKSCTHTIDEFSSYQRKKDKHGQTLEEPVGENDHCIAALRYGLMDYVMKHIKGDKLQIVVL